MDKNTKRTILLLIAIISFGLCRGLDSFLYQYNNPAEVITNVRTLKLTNYGSAYILALEGRDLQTDTYFTRVQSIDNNGVLINDYSGAYIGQPLTISSGVFEMRDFFSTILTPKIEYNPDSLKYFFNWYYGDTDQNYSYTGFALPDSFQTIIDFPAASQVYRSLVFDTKFYLTAGKAIFNGVNRCFLVDTDNNGSYGKLVIFPGLNNISGIRKINDGYLAIGHVYSQDAGWMGRIILVDYNSNLIWQQDVTIAVDVSEEDMFNTPLMTSSVYNPIIVSYQNADKSLHLARYQNQSLQDIYSLSLDGYVGAIPLCISDSLVAFAYVKDGKQFISQIDLRGDLKWTRQLPGVGNLGKNCLNLHYTANEAYYIIGSILPQGGYYIARINSSNGQIDNDTITIPPAFEISYTPNPGNGILNISLDVKTPGKVKLEIYNLKGQKLSSLLEDYYPAGKFKTQINIQSKISDHLPSGIYLISASLDNRKIVKRITILK